jgi:hypothetical protein
MKRYTLEVTITEGNDHFWNAIKGTGCDEVLEAVKAALAERGWDADYEFADTSVRLVKFEETK